MSRITEHRAFWDGPATDLERAARERVCPDWPWPWDPLRLSATFDAVVGCEVTGRTVLDYGCGVGRLARVALDRGASRVYGVDVSPGMLRLAEEYAGSPRFVPVLTDGLGTGLEGVRADVVWSFLVLQHAWSRAQVWAALRAMADTLVPGGQLSAQFRRGLPEHEIDCDGFEGIAVSEGDVLGFLRAHGVDARVVECRDQPGLPSGGLYDWWTARGVQR